MKNALWGAVLALQFLTRLPIPIAAPWTSETRRWAVRAFPFVGLLIGTVLALVAFGMHNVPAPITALTLLSIWVAISGGLHLDGVMDIADALGSNQPLARRWEIMKDPQIGSFGMLALVFLLAWKGVLLVVAVSRPRARTLGRRGVAGADPLRPPKRVGLELAAIA